MNGAVSAGAAPLIERQKQAAPNPNVPATRCGIFLVKLGRIGNSRPSQPVLPRRTVWAPFTMREGESMGDRGQSRTVQTLTRQTAALVLALLALAPAARAERVALDPDRAPRIVNGLNTHDYASTGALLYSFGGPITANNASVQCSGTLIGCSTFLVAAHCVVGDTNPTHYQVYLQNAGLMSVSSITYNPSYFDPLFPKYDTAVVKLATPVTGIRPTLINQTSPEPFLPIGGTIVGFGQTAGGANNYGIKRVGAVQAVTCPANLPAGATDVDVVCWNFTTFGAPGTNSNTCNGDSGGPLFLDLGSGPVVAGITSGGTSSNCLPTDHSYDANVYTHRAFILGQLGADSTSACGSLPPVGDAQTTVINSDGALDATTSAQTYTIHLPAGADAMRVALNGRDSGLLDVNLYVKHGLGASSSSFDCKADGASVFGACTFNSPGSGTWSMAVERATGSGDYQLTTTVFGVTPATCGNGVAELGEQCDGGDAATCPGLCDATCHCPAPCRQGDLTEIRGRVDAKRFALRAVLRNFSGTFDGADPRQGFTLSLVQGTNTLTIDVPADSSGWAASSPSRGRYKWAGNLQGITRVRALDRSAAKGIWKILVVGKSVPGAGAFDPLQPVDLTLTINGICTATTY
jgi:hypothetical protein